jgi:DNA polymerase-3 subunit beta
MRFTALSKDLKTALEGAMACAAKRTTIQILTHVLVEAKGSEVFITASDLDCEVRLTVAASVQQEGAEAIDGGMFTAFVSRVKGGDVALESIDGDVKLTSGRAKAELPTLPAETFPSLGRPDGMVQFAIDGDGFQDMLAGVAHAASTEETRYYLCGVYLHAQAGKWIAVTTDGHRLHKIELAAPSGGHALPPVIVPAKTVQLVQKLFFGAAAIALHVSPVRVSIVTDSATLNSKLIDGTYPDYNRVIPRDQPYSIRTSRDGLVAAIGRASIAGELIPAVKFSISGDTIVVSGSKGGNAMSSDEVDAQCGDANFEIGATARYLTDALAMLEGNDVTISVSDPSSPFVFRGEREGALAVVMPRRC